MVLGRRAALASAGAMTALATGGAGPPAGALLRRTIPSSGETVPAIGLGTAGGDEDVSSEAAFAPLRKTIRTFRGGGGTVIDTASTYGDAEAVVGRIAQELGIREPLFLATKVDAVGREAGSGRSRDRSATCAPPAST